MCCESGTQRGHWRLFCFTLSQKRWEDISRRLARFKLMPNVKGLSMSQGRCQRTEEPCTLRGLPKRQEKPSCLACCFGPMEGGTLELEIRCEWIISEAEAWRQKGKQCSLYLSFFEGDRLLLCSQIVTLGTLASSVLGFQVQDTLSSTLSRLMKYTWQEPSRRNIRKLQHWGGAQFSLIYNRFVWVYTFLRRKFPNFLIPCFFHWKIISKVFYVLYTPYTTQPGHPLLPSSI